MDALIYEKIIIGGISGGTVKPSDVDLAPGDFGEADLSRFFAASHRLETEGKPISAEVLDLVAGYDGFYQARDLESWQQSARSAAVVFEAVEKIKSGNLKSYLLRESANIALRENLSGEQILDVMREIVEHAEMNYKTLDNSFQHISEVVKKNEAIYRDLHGGISYAVPTFFKDLDDQITDGFSKGDMHTVVGFTGAGKTSLALTIAKAQARRGAKVAWLTREMSSEQNVTRMVAGETQIPRRKIRKNLPADILNELLFSLKELSNLPFFLDKTTSDVESLKPKVKRMVETHGIEILYVDYLQLMSSSKNSTRANEVASVSRTLKEIAMDNNIPVVPLCQFSRGAMNANIYEIMNYLKESSGIEQDSSTILYVQVEKTEEKKERKDAKVTVLKNREGATFQPIEFWFKGETFEFQQKLYG